jgi:hypothetical protein
MERLGNMIAATGGALAAGIVAGVGFVVNPIVGAFIISVLLILIGLIIKELK